MSISIAMATLSKIGEVSLTLLLQALEKDWPKLPQATNVERNNGIHSFSLGGTTVFVAHMPAPIPGKDLEDICATSMLWPDAAEALQSHEMHLIISVSSDSSAIERASVLTQVVASMISISPSLNGVFWCDAEHVISAPIFRDYSIEFLPDALPFHLWVNFRVGRNENARVSGFTRGLTELGLMDFETETATDTPRELRDRFETLTDYLLENGLIIKDGDSVGGDETEKIHVIFSDSQFGKSTQVMRLEYAETRKPFWKIW
ncbi:DUF4261 domain-containing protein [Janthinobacterium sp. SUN073]|uniref:DUF4261 domain-containing protein n=1 Tax=Janthinobacterium sp. SUN073 TaxID=3004102 RepID=UPI0025B04BB1|nr:DUF4261 domain-containing protein [Janthinobacterium sp. SUN073]MDN2696849.1 DUF4261 domain-containing protein [Janthinobacterium sp. SUN073]